MDQNNDPYSHYFSHIISLFNNAHPQPIVNSEDDNTFVGAIKLLLWMTLAITLIVKWIVTTCDLFPDPLTDKVREDFLTEDNSRNGGSNVKSGCNLRQYSNDISTSPLSGGLFNRGVNKRVHFANDISACPETNAISIIGDSQENEDDYVIFDSESSSCTTSEDGEVKNLEEQVKNHSISKELFSGDFNSKESQKQDSPNQPFYVKCVADTCPKTVMKLVYHETNSLKTDESSKEFSVTERRKPLNYFVPLSDSISPTKFVPSNQESIEDGYQHSNPHTGPNLLDLLRSPKFIPASTQSVPAKDIPSLTDPTHCDLVANSSEVNQLITPYTESPFKEELVPARSDSPLEPASRLLNRKFGLEIKENHSDQKLLPKNSESPSPTHSTSTTLSIELSPRADLYSPSPTEQQACGNNVRRQLKYGSTKQNGNIFQDGHQSAVLLEGSLKSCSQVYQVEAKSSAICKSNANDTFQKSFGNHEEDIPSVANVKAYGENPFLALARATAHAATIASAKAAFDITTHQSNDTATLDQTLPPTTLSNMSSHSCPVPSDLTILVSTSCTIRNINSSEVNEVNSIPKSLSNKVGDGTGDLGHHCDDNMISNYARVINESLSSTLTSHKVPISPVITYEKNSKFADETESREQSDKYLINGSAFERVINDMKRAEDKATGYTVLAQNVAPSQRIIKPILVKSHGTSNSGGVRAAHLDPGNERHITLSPQVIEHEVPYEDRAGNWLPGPDTDDDEDDTVCTLNTSSIETLATRTQIKLIDRKEVPLHVDQKLAPHSIHSHNPPLDEIAKLAQEKGHIGSAVTISEAKDEVVENKNIVTPTNSSTYCKKDNPIPCDESTKKLFKNKYVGIPKSRSSSDGNVTSHLSKIWDKIPKRTSSNKGTSSQPKITKPTIERSAINELQTQSNFPKVRDLVKESICPSIPNQPLGQQEIVKNLVAKPPLPNGHVAKNPNVVATIGIDNQTISGPTDLQTNTRYRDIVSPSKALINKLKNKYMTPSPLTNGRPIGSDADANQSLQEMGAFDRAINRYRSHSRSSLASDSSYQSLAGRNQVLASHPAMRSLLSKSLGDLSTPNHNWPTTTGVTTFNRLPSPSNPAISEAHKTFDRLFQASMTKLSNSTTPNKSRRATLSHINGPPVAPQRSMSLCSVLLLNQPMSEYSSPVLDKVVGETDIDAVFEDARRESDALKSPLPTPIISLVEGKDSLPKTYNNIIHCGINKDDTNDSLPSTETMALLARLKDSTSHLDLPSWMSRSSLSSYQDHSREDLVHRRPFSRTSLIVLSGDESGVGEMNSDTTENIKKCGVRYRSGDFRKVDLSLSDTSSCLDHSTGNTKDTSYEHEESGSTNDFQCNDKNRDYRHANGFTSSNTNSKNHYSAVRPKATIDRSGSVNGSDDDHFNQKVNDRRIHNLSKNLSHNEGPDHHKNKALTSVKARICQIEQHSMAKHSDSSPKKCSVLKDVPEPRDDSDDTSYIRTAFNKQTQLKNISFSDENDDSFLLVLDSSNRLNHYDQNDTPDNSDVKMICEDRGIINCKQNNSTYNSDQSLDDSFNARRQNYTNTNRQQRVLKLKTETCVHLSTAERYSDKTRPAAGPIDHVTHKMASYGNIYSRTKLDQSESSDERTSQHSTYDNIPEVMYAREEYSYPNHVMDGRMFTNGDLVNGILPPLYNGADQVARTKMIKSASRYETPV